MRNARYIYFPWPCSGLKCSQLRGEGDEVMICRFDHSGFQAYKCQTLAHTLIHTIPHMLISHPYIGAIALRGAHHGSGLGPIHVDDIHCVGNESSLLECPHNDSPFCSHSEDAGVICPLPGIHVQSCVHSYMHNTYIYICIHNYVYAYSCWVSDLY